MRRKINNRHEKRPKNENVRLYRFKRYILHPLRWTGWLAFMWPVPAILIIYFTNVNINFDGFALFVMLPPAILIGLNGFYMIQRDEYIQHAGGNIGYGFPAKWHGCFFVIFSWGGAIHLITGVIFHWF